MAGCKEGCQEEFKGSNFKLSHQTPHLFVTSQWENSCRCTIFYVIFRLLVAAFFLVMTVLSGALEYDWYTTDSQRVKWFIYLTNWSFFTLTIDVTIQAVIASYAFHKQRTTGPYVLAFPEMTWYLKMEWVVSNIAQCNSIVISIAFWAVIYYPGKSIHFVDINTHATNSIYILVNMFITAMPVRIYHVFHPLILTAIYVIFTVIYDLTGGTNALEKPYIYSVLDWSANAADAGLYTFLIGFVVVLVVWLILYGLYRLRLVIYGAIMARRGIAVEDASQYNGHEMTGERKDGDMNSSRP